MVKEVWGKVTSQGLPKMTLNLVPWSHSTCVPLTGAVLDEAEHSIRCHGCLDTIAGHAPSNRSRMSWILKRPLYTSWVAVSGCTSPPGRPWRHLWICMTTMAATKWPQNVVKTSARSCRSDYQTWLSDSEVSSLNATQFSDCDLHSNSWQEAPVSPRDRAMRHVSWNLANCHATVQKLLVRQVLNKLKLWSWRVTVSRCVINMCTQPWRNRVASIVLQVS